MDDRPKVKTTHKPIYVVGLPEFGGCWLPSDRFYTDYDLAYQIVQSERARGLKTQLFTLFGYEKAE